MDEQPRHNLPPQKSRLSYGRSPAPSRSKPLDFSGIMLTLCMIITGVFGAILVIVIFTQTIGLAGTIFASIIVVAAATLLVFRMVVDRHPPRVGRRRETILCRQCGEDLTESRFAACPGCGELHPHSPVAVARRMGQEVDEPDLP